MTTGVDQQSDDISPPSFGPQGNLHVEVISQCERWSELTEVRLVLEKAARVVANEPGLREKLNGQVLSNASVTIALSDDSAVRQLNKTHRNIDKPTNVLSFPSAPMPAYHHGDSGMYLGDIVIAYETVISEAEAQGLTVEAHLSHLAIHGLLHVLGYDHETDDDAHEMEQLEVSLLAKLGITNPYNEMVQDEIEQ